MVSKLFEFKRGNKWLTTPLWSDDQAWETPSRFRDSNNMFDLLAMGDDGDEDSVVLQGGDEGRFGVVEHEGEQTSTREVGTGRRENKKEKKRNGRERNGVRKQKQGGDEDEWVPRRRESTPHSWRRTGRRKTTNKNRRRREKRRRCRRRRRRVGQPNGRRRSLRGGGSVEDVEVCAMWVICAFSEAPGFDMASAFLTKHTVWLFRFVFCLDEKKCAKLILCLPCGVLKPFVHALIH